MLGAPSSLCLVEGKCHDRSLTPAIAPPAAVVMVGLGAMGLPMAARLKHAGFEVRGVDPLPAARAAFEDKVGPAFEAAAEAAKGGRLLLPCCRTARWSATCC